jgi:GNAT superfamily N-acetyltransferase
MLKLLRTNSKNQDFIYLVKLLDAELAERDGEDHAFYDQFNKIDTIRHVIVLYENNLAIGCGAIKEVDVDTTEIKRMYTLPSRRGNGFATQILSEIISWASELKYDRCILETGKKQPEAIRLYKKNGFTRIPNYGQYTNIENSVCFEKKFNQRISDYLE